PNDEVNSIASQRFIHQFGRAGVWQLAALDRDRHHKTAAASDVRAQTCFSGGPDHAALQALAAGGAVMKRSNITDVFTLEDFRLTYEEQTAVILFLSDETKGLRPCPAELKKVAPGTTLYVLVKEKESPGLASPVTG
ncbi:MAG: hypothetical protein AAGB14_14260, partial [Verrucomicrobiota bacterium]